MKQYQLNVLKENEHGEKIVVRVEDIAAESLSAAWQEVNRVHSLNAGEGNVRVYPLAKLCDAESILELARGALRSVERWERVNHFAALEPYKRSKEDKEDFVQIAALSIVETLTGDPVAPMFDAARAAFTAISTEKKRRARNSERVYLPGWASCNIAPRTPRATATTPDLDRLIREAVKAADFTASQAAVFARFFDGTSVADISAELGISRSAAYRALYRAFHKLLTTMDKIDPLRQIAAVTDGITRNGIDFEAISEAIAKLAKRAK